MPITKIAPEGRAVKSSIVTEVKKVGFLCLFWFLGFFGICYFLFVFVVVFLIVTECLLQSNERGETSDGEGVVACCWQNRNQRGGEYQCSVGVLFFPILFSWDTKSWDHANHITVCLSPFSEPCLKKASQTLMPLVCLDPGKLTTEMNHYSTHKAVGEQM